MPVAFRFPASPGGATKFSLARYTRFSSQRRRLDHVVPHAHGGSNSYRNLVSCCNDCNSKKADRRAVEHVRSLYRDPHLSSDELTGRLCALDDLAAGKLPPQLPIHKSIGSKRLLTPRHEIARHPGASTFCERQPSQP